MLTCLNICVVMWRSGSGCTNSSFHRYTQITSIFNYFCSSSWPYSNMLIWCWHWPGYLHIYKPRYLQMAAFISLQCWRCTRSLLLAHHHCHCTVHITKLPKSCRICEMMSECNKAEAARAANHHGIIFRDSNEGSRTFHNHGEDRYQGSLSILKVAHQLWSLRRQFQIYLPLAACSAKCVSID